MLVTRTVAGATQFDPTDPLSGLFDLGAVIPGYPEIAVKIESGGYDSAGAPHRIAVWLQPPGPVIAGGPKIVIATADPANSVTFQAGCGTAVPRDDTVGWTLRVETTGKTADATVSVYFLQQQVTS